MSEAILPSGNLRAQRGAAAGAEQVQSSAGAEQVQSRCAGHSAGCERRATVPLDGAWPRLLNAGLAWVEVRHAHAWEERAPTLNATELGTGLMSSSVLAPPGQCSRSRAGRTARAPRAASRQKWRRQARAQLADEEEDIALLSDGSELSSEALGGLNVLEIEL